ncbi:PTS sugar transporter subunit IIA [Ligilactobacillus saerimneri]|nr:PTS mannose transporter subunit IIA [Ligilactobacillus saerimneri]
MKMKYLVATHGKLASGFRSSIDILTGKGANLTTIDAYVDDSDYTEKIQAFIASVADDEQALIFTDLFGGSVNQKVVTQLVPLEKDNIFVISNSNLAIILSLMMLPEGMKLTPTIINNTIAECQVQLVETSLPEDEQDDDFFA